MKPRCVCVCVLKDKAHKACCVHPGQSQRELTLFLALRFAKSTKRLGSSLWSQYESTSPGWGRGGSQPVHLPTFSQVVVKELVTKRII